MEWSERRQYRKRRREEEGLTRITSPKFIRHHTLNYPLDIFRLRITSTCINCRFVDFVICCMTCLHISSSSLDKESERSASGKDIGLFSVTSIEMQWKRLGRKRT